MAQNALLTPLVLHAIKYFDAAARTRSFTRAAEELHVTQGAVSQQIRGLEEQIGVRLFNRLPRGLALTPEGERFSQVVNQALRELETGLRAIQPGTANKTLVIRSSPSFSMMWLMPRLSGFSRLFPEIEIRLRGELFGMSTSRMNAEAIDLLVLYGLPPEPAGHVIPLMAEYLMPVASPAYLDSHAAIRGGADFSSHVLLHDDSPWEGAAPFAEWGAWLRAAADKKHQADAEQAGQRGHQYNLSHLAINAALLGQGVAMARTSLIMDELGRQQLLPAIPRCVRAPAGYYLVLNPDTAGKASIELFREWLVQECNTFTAGRDLQLAQFAALS